MSTTMHATAQQARRSAQRAAVAPAQAKHLDPLVSAKQTLQRAALACACGGGCPRCSAGDAVFGGLKPSASRGMRAQAKLAIGARSDPFELEADQVAEHVLAALAHSEVRSELPRIRRYTKHATGGTDTPPASVDRVLASPGNPMHPVLRQSMESQFGHDFSAVRMHTDAAAEESAQDVSAHAFTVGHDVVFGAGRFAPQTHAGRRLIAHELTHVVQQHGGTTAVQRAPDGDAEEDDDEIAAARPARVRSCPGGAMPYNGVCLTDEILEALPPTGDVHAAVQDVKVRAQENSAQRAVEDRSAKLSDSALSKKIDAVRKSADGTDAVPSHLRRLEKERSRRRAVPISSPDRVDQAIAMLEEAWSLAEKEQPPDLRRASYLVHVVNNWLQKAAPASRYGECFSGFAKTTAMQTVGMAKGNVHDLERKFRLGASIGGWWPATINSLRAARELVQIMSGEKRIEETTFNAVSKTINTTAVATPLIGAAIMALPVVVVVAAAKIPALPATIGGVKAAVWGQTLFGAMLSASYLNHVVKRSKEAAASQGGSNPFAIAAAAIVDAPGLGQVVEAASNQSILTGDDLHLSKTERAVGVIAGILETGMNWFGAKDLLSRPPAFKPPTRVTTRSGEINLAERGSVNGRPATTTAGEINLAERGSVNGRPTTTTVGEINSPPLAKPRVATVTRFWWANPRMKKGNFIDATLKDGRLTATVKSHGPDRRRGTQLFDDVFDHFGNKNIKEFESTWVRDSTFRDNYDEFMKNVNAKMTETEAAWNTWTGQELKRRGFTSVEVPPHGPDIVSPVFRR